MQVLNHREALGARLVRTVGSIDVGVVSSSPTLVVETTFKNDKIFKIKQ